MRATTGRYKRGKNDGGTSIIGSSKGPNKGIRRIAFRSAPIPLSQSLSLSVSWSPLVRLSLPSSLSMMLLLLPLLLLLVPCCECLASSSNGPSSLSASSSPSPSSISVSSPSPSPSPSSSSSAIATTHTFVPAASKKALHPPLVLLGGIAQTKSSWDHHLAALARDRDVLVYECLGQGGNTGGSDNDTDHDTNHDKDNDGDVWYDASLPTQARHLLEELERVFCPDQRRGHTSTGDATATATANANDPPLEVDIAGFSFGGRVALASACLQLADASRHRDRNDGDRDGDGDGDGDGDCTNIRTPIRIRIRIRRLHLTGVGCDRSDHGHMAMRSFPEVISADPSLRSFAWSILLATYSPSYLRGLPEATLERFVHHVASTNDPKGLLAVLEQAEVTDTDDPWHVVSMARRLGGGDGESDGESESDGASIPGALCVGELDTMAPVEEVLRLRALLGWDADDVDVLAGCGHAVVLENPRAWRESVLSFLNRE